MAYHLPFRTATVAVLLAAAATAQAGTVQFNGWAYETGNGVSLKERDKTVQVQAGSFDVTLSGFDGIDALNGDFYSYCVELEQSIGLQGRYSNYSIVKASSHFDSRTLSALTGLLGFLDASKAMERAQPSFDDDQSTAVQLAIWNIVYDTDNTLVHSSGARFSEAPMSSRTQYQAARAHNDGTRFIGADALLAGASSFAGTGGYDLYVLRSANQQDQLIWARGTVPEPSSLALVALAIGAAGFAARRQR